MIEGTGDLHTCSVLIGAGMRFLRISGLARGERRRSPLRAGTAGEHGGGHGDMGRAPARKQTLSASPHLSEHASD
jgi:hypothetical protein